MAFRERLNEPLRRFLARVETQEPTWSLWDPSAERFGEKWVVTSANLDENAIQDYLEHDCVRWVLTGVRDDWHIKMTFGQQTPDGELITTIYTGMASCRLTVELGYHTLEELYYFARELVEFTTATSHGAKIDEFAVRHVRDWVRRRVLPALDGAHRRRLERQEIDRRERAAKIATLRDKYLR